MITILTRMGKVARKITQIINPRDRKVTFKKRHDGVMKKIHELGILCNQDTFLFVRDRVTQRVRMFSSIEEHFIPHYANIKQEDRKGPSDMQRHYNKTRKLAAPDTMSPLPPSTETQHESERHVYTSLLQQGQACHRILEGILLLQFQ